MAETKGKAETEKVEQEALTAVNAALETLAAASKVDDATLKEIDDTLKGMNDATRRAVIELPAFQKLVETAQDNAPADARPGTTIQAGMFSYKKPYSLEDIYTIQGIYPSFVPARDEVVGYEGFVWRLREGIIYDIPRDVPMEKVPEGHGYVVPNIVVGIINDKIAQLRQNRKETEQQNFGMGVQHIQVGWGGKDTVIGNVEFSGPPTDEK